MQPVDGLGAGWTGHVLLAYHSEQERGAGVAAWVRRGLDAGARIVYIDAAGDRDVRRLPEVLADNGVDAVSALARRQLQLIDPGRSGASSAWQKAVVADGLRAGYPAVHVAGEVSASWKAMSAEAHDDAERTAEALCRTRPVSVLCQYPADTDAAVLTAACALHGAGTRGARLQTVPLSVGVALIGEVDTANQKVLRSVLAAACGSAREERSAVRVDMSELHFLDTAGARALLMATTAHRARGGVLRLHAARPNVGRLLRVLGVDRVHGVVLEDAA
ncbi:MAG TPA: MEDS domain-containing protein [Jatrophihabitans sp.]|nr:MEDS domain-containing protein [Jatrophihabitans sp.]